MLSQNISHIYVLTQAEKGEVQFIHKIMPRIKQKNNPTTGPTK